MSAESETFHLTLQGPGISLDKDVSQAVALAVLQVAFGAQDMPNFVAASGADASQPNRSPRLSLREFLDGARARSNPQKITVFAGYLRDYVRKEDFSRDELKACFRTAGESAPANFARDFGVAVQNGWIAEDPATPGRYYLTRRGEEAIKAPPEKPE